MSRLPLRRVGHRPLLPELPRGAPPDPLVGKVLGNKYRVVRLLGEGGMGAVYEGEQQLGTTQAQGGRQDAAPASLATTRRSRRASSARSARSRSSQHPNTIQVYDFGTTPDGILYIVMEFLQGKSLADTLEKGGAMTARPRRATSWRRCAARSRRRTASGIVHRDLKPDNIVLIERAGQKDFVKVLDFGIAKRPRKRTRTSRSSRSRAWCSGRRRT